MTALLRWLTLASAFVAASAFADPMPLTSSLVAADPIQLGRLSRGGVPQDWAGNEGGFPGVINTATAYHYRVYYLFLGLTPYVQIDVDEGANTFVAAYQTSYNPANPAATWLGDAGSSGLYFGAESIGFQVKGALNSYLAIVVNETLGAGGGLGQPFTLLAQGFTNTGYDGATDLAFLTAIPSAVPEPPTVALLFVSLAALGITARRRRRG